MIVRDLIKELEELPQDLPVVTDYREIDCVKQVDAFYFLNDSVKEGYTVDAAVVLE